MSAKAVFPRDNSHFFDLFLVALDEDQAECAPEPGEPLGEYEVERILDARRIGRGFQYLVKWKWYDTATWEPGRNLKNAPEVLAEFMHQMRAAK